MDLAPESSSEGGLAIFVAQQAIYRRVVEADYMSHRAFFRVLHDLLTARSAPFSLLDLACGDAACSVGALCGTKVSDYTAVDLAEPALSLAASNARSLRCATEVVHREFSGVCQRRLSAVGRHFHWLFVSPPKQQSQSCLRTSNSPRAERGGRMDFLRTDAPRQGNARRVS